MQHRFSEDVAERVEEAMVVVPVDHSPFHTFLTARKSIPLEAKVQI